MRRTGSIVAGVLLAAAACGGGPEPAAARPASTAKVAILEPRIGATVPPDRIPVRVKVTGARLLKEASRTIAPDTGHIHVAVDGKTISIASGLEPTFDLAELTGAPLSAGRHLLQIEFVAADHGFFDPRVITTVTFTVR